MRARVVALVLVSAVQSCVERPSVERDVLELDAALGLFDGGLGPRKPDAAPRLGDPGATSVSAPDSDAAALVPADAGAPEAPEARGVQRAAPEAGAGRAGAAGAASAEAAAGVGAAGVRAAGAAGAAGDATPQVAVGSVVFSELMADPKAVSDSDGEWLELFNRSSAMLDLTGCAIRDGAGAASARRISEPLRIAAGGYVVIARSAAAGFTPDAVLPISLTNTADAVELLCGEVSVDRVAYDKQLGFPIAAGVSAALDPELLDPEANDDPGAWCPATASYGADRGSPGAANDGCGHTAADSGVETTP